MGSKGSVDLLIIGAGPSGLAAALAARRGGAQRVLILDKEKKAGRKLLASGNGRCNLSHVAASSDCYVSSEPSDLERIFRKLPKQLETQFFPGLGIPSFSDSEGRLYPLSEEASSVQELLLRAVQESRAELRLEQAVLGLRKQAGGFEARLESGTILTRALLLACGSKAAPQLGGSASAERFADDLHLAYCPEVPTLTALVLEEKNLCKRASGGRFKGQVRFGSSAERGEFLFTDYGLSGIAGMDLSSRFGRKIAEKSPGLQAEQLALRQPEEIRVDFFPNESTNGLLSQLKDSSRALQTTRPDLLLRGYLKERIIRALFDGKQNLPVEQIAARLKAWPLHVRGLRGFPYAQAAQGGLRLSNFSSDLSAAGSPGLFAAGEALDVSGRCGGYSLYWAFASGLRAGQAAAAYLRRA